MATKLTTLTDEVIYVDYTTAKAKAVEEDKSRESRCPFENDTELRVVWHEITKEDNTKVKCPKIPLLPYELDGVKAEGHYLHSIVLTDGRQEWTAHVSMFKSVRGYDSEEKEISLDGFVQVWRDTNKSVGIVWEALADAMTNENYRFILKRRSFKKKDKDGRLYRSSIITIVKKD